MAKWFYLVDGHEIGPVETSTLKLLAESGRLNLDDKVRREDMADWYWAEDLTGVFSWFYLVNGREVGPVESSTLKSLAKLGQLKPDDLVRRNGSTEWHEAKQVLGPIVAAQAPSPRLTNKDARILAGMGALISLLVFAYATYSYATLPNSGQIQGNGKSDASDKLPKPRIKLTAVDSNGKIRLSPLSALMSVLTFYVVNAIEPGITTIVLSVIAILACMITFIERGKKAG